MHKDKVFEKSESKGVPYEYIRDFFVICHPGFFPVYQELGVHWCQSDFTWDRIESSPGKIDFQWIDDMIEEARKYDVSILPILDYCARWASIGDTTNYPPRKRAYWERYVKRTVSRYSVSPYNIKYYQPWSEPNILHNWGLDWEKYIDEVMIPAAKIIHRYNCFVVAPSVTLEHFGYSPACFEFLQRWNLKNCIERIDEWLSYHDAYKYIDILSFHYSKGDTGEEKGESTSNLMPFYDHIYDKWIKSGKIKGMWNTEEGLTAEHLPGEKATLERWEKPPYGQWVPRYIIPVLSWAIEHNWDFKDKYKLCWYALVGKPTDTLAPTKIIIDSGKSRMTEVGMALKTLTKKIFTGETSIYQKHKVFSEKGEKLVSYGFKVDDRLIIATWVDKNVKNVEFHLGGLNKEKSSNLKLSRIDYLSGKETNINQFKWVSENRENFLKVSIDTEGQPIIYLGCRL